jgi:hypothetical protein
MKKVDMRDLHDLHGLHDLNGGAQKKRPHPMKMRPRVFNYEIANRKLTELTPLRSLPATVLDHRLIPFT